MSLGSVDMVMVVNLNGFNKNFLFFCDVYHVCFKLGLAVTKFQKQPMKPTI